MELKIVALDGKDAGKATLSDAIFGLEPRTDIIQRCVNWQLAKRQRGTHKTKGRSEIWRTGNKSGAADAEQFLFVGPWEVTSAKDPRIMQFALKYFF